MSNVTLSVPRPSRHKATGQAVVRLSGKDHYLGKYGTATAKAEYDRLIQRWLANGRRLPQEDDALSIAELVVAYLRFAGTYYVKGGARTSEYAIIRQSMRWLRRFHREDTVSEFGPKSFKAIRERVIAENLSRHTVNTYMSCIRRCFRWGVEEELVPADVFHGLQAVAGLKRGRCEARETNPVKPVSQACIDVVLPLVAPQIAAMIGVQLLTGCRPGEVCLLRGCDLETSGKV